MRVAAESLRLLDPVEILDNLANSCSRSQDPAFWILTSAAAHCNGYDLNDGHPSTTWVYFWSKYAPRS